MITKHGKAAISGFKTKQTTTTTASKRIATPEAGELLAQGSLSSVLMERFWEDIPYENSVFVMLGHGGDPAQQREIKETIKCFLPSYGLNARFPKDKSYSKDNLVNTRIYMQGSKYGIAVFESLGVLDSNSKVAFQLGYMLALGKRCLVLKDSGLVKRPGDLCQALYKEFDRNLIEDTIITRIKKWVKKDHELADIYEKAEFKSCVEGLRDTKESVRKDSFQALASRRDEKAVVSLSEALVDDSSKVRLEAVEALRAISPDTAVDSIIKVLEHDKVAVRKDAILSLGNIATDNAVKGLGVALKDENFLVRGVVIETLGKTKNKKAIGPLTKALKDPDRRVKRKAVEVLEKMASEDAVEPLIYALKERDHRMQMQAAKVLRTIKSPKTEDALITILKEKDNEVPGLAASILGDVGGKKALIHLKRFLNDPTKRWWTDQTVGELAKESMEKIEQRIR